MWEVLKSCAHAAAAVVTVPAVCSFYLRGLILGRDRALEGSTQALALIPGIIGQYLRRAFLRRALAYCDRTAVVEYGTIFSAIGTRIDEYVYIGPGCYIGLAHFKRGALVGPAVQVPSGRLTHGIDDPSRPIREQPGKHQLVRIGAEAWIGGAAIVMADVGEGTVVGAGAVVTKPLPAGVVAGGVPARILHRRDVGVKVSTQSA